MYYKVHDLIRKEMIKKRAMRDDNKNKVYHFVGQDHNQLLFSQPPPHCTLCCYCF